MPEKRKDSAVKSSSLATYLAVAAIAALAGVGAVYVTFGPAGNGAPEPPAKPVAQQPAPDAPPAGKGLAALATGEMANFVAKDAPAALPAFTVRDGSGAEKSLADWRGKVVLLNLWATWCAPCRKEMPSLDRLQGALGGAEFEVVAISIDKGDATRPKAFLDEIKAGNLAFYQDPSAKLNFTLKALGMPTTLLIDREGREIGRLVGPAEWDSEEAKALLEAAIAKQG